MKIFIANIQTPFGNIDILTDEPGQMIEDHWKRWGLKVNSITPINMESFYRILCIDRKGREYEIPIYGNQDADYFVEKYSQKGIYKSVKKEEISKDEWVKIMKRKSSY